MKSFLFLFMFPALLMFSGNSASQERLDIVTDLLPEWSFPKGIEGPAIDKNGNLFAVNFKNPGTIGIVTPKKSKRPSITRIIIAVVDKLAVEANTLIATIIPMTIPTGIKIRNEKANPIKRLYNPK